MWNKLILLLSMEWLWTAGREYLWIILALMRKGRLSLAEAKEKYPDWYERRIVKKERRGRWTVKRDLYDWWLHRIADEIRVGHRFYGIMTLAIYAKKCGISEEELRHDAFSLLEPYDDMSVEDINRFTKDDVVCALEMFNDTELPRKKQNQCP